MESLLSMALAVLAGRAQQRELLPLLRRVLPLPQGATTTQTLASGKGTALVSGNHRPTSSMNNAKATSTVAVPRFQWHSRRVTDRRSGAPSQSHTSQPAMHSTPIVLTTAGVVISRTQIANVPSIVPSIWSRYSARQRNVREKKGIGRIQRIWIICLPTCHVQALLQMSPGRRALTSLRPSRLHEGTTVPTVTQRDGRRMQHSSSIHASHSPRTRIIFANCQDL